VKIVSLEPLAVPTTPVQGAARLWRINEGVRCVYEVGRERFVRLVPAGFETDGPSVPRILGGLVTNVEWAASVVHDHEYQHRPRGIGVLGSALLKWRRDWRFRQNLRYTRRRWGLSRVQRFLYAVKHEGAMWPAVVVFGWPAWVD
jgi:hypothetical protein